MDASRREPPRWGVRVDGPNPYDRTPEVAPELPDAPGYVGSGTMAALIVVIPGAVAWVLLWDAGLLLSAISAVTTLLACRLYVWGSRAALTPRGAAVAAATSLLTTALAVGTVVLLIAASVYRRMDTSLVFALPFIFEDRFLLWFNLVFLPSETGFGLWAPGALFALALTGLGTVVGVWSALGRTLRPAPQVGLAVAAVAFFLLSLYVNSTVPRSLTPMDAPKWQVGDCLQGEAAQYDEVALGRDLALPRLPAIKCSEYHDAEVIAVTVLPDSSEGGYPNPEWFGQQADALCAAPLEAYIDPTYREYPLQVFLYFPRESEWVNGEREAICVVETTDQFRRTSVRALDAVSQT